MRSLVLFCMFVRMHVREPR